MLVLNSFQKEPTMADHPAKYTARISNYTMNISLMQLSLCLQGSWTEKAFEAPRCAFPLEPRKDGWCLGPPSFSGTPQAP
jgi:hypothetical protein